jgi:hypothetical protein
MLSVPHTKPTRPYIPPRSRAVFAPWVVLFLLALTVGITAPAWAAKPANGDSVHRFQFHGDFSGQVDLVGGLTFRFGEIQDPLLTTEVISEVDVRRRRGADTFHAVVVEGAQAGRRGFSPMADDDQDGQTDEDPLDGLDNDQDGRIDEDFAAISDAMVTVHLGEPGSEGHGLHLEYYHWDTTRLNPAVFLDVGGDRGGYRIHSSGASWQVTRINALQHTLSGRSEQKNTMALVCRASLDDSSIDGDPCEPGAGLWLGVMILDENSSSRFVLDGDQLDLALDSQSVPLVMCAADSWTQLNRILGDALKVYAGVTDPVDNRQARWIILPSCTACRNAPAPQFSLQTATEGETTLTAHISSGQCGLLDPDLFQIAGSWLGVPRQIRWVPTGGQPTEAVWTCMTGDRLRSSPSAAASLAVFAELQTHQAQGRLEFIFESSGKSWSTNPSETTTVVGRFLDGRTLESSLAGKPTKELEVLATASSPMDSESESVEEATLRFAKDRAELLKSGPNQPSLSADLLIGWPNPFNDAISIRFVVPRTVKEAFVWKNDKDKLEDIDLEAEIPWSGGQPSVSVKIYSINGQELVTLHSASMGVGEHTVHWNGTDAFGRKVASGTYFCKLQLDDWSVTRRLVFLR